MSVANGGYQFAAPPKVMRNWLLAFFQSSSFDPQTGMVRKEDYGMYLPEGKPKRLTISFPKPVYEVLKEFSDEMGLTLSETVRLATQSNIANYLDSVRFLDSEQAKQIAENQSVVNKNICALFNELQDIRNELRRIGINYNQQVKLLNEQKKAGRRIYPERNLLDEKSFSEQIERFETAAAEVGEKLCQCQK